MDGDPWTRPGPSAPVGGSEAPAGGAPGRETTAFMESMSEELVVIRTYSDEPSADAAQAELLNAGIQSLLFSDGAPPVPSAAEAGAGIGLAVHRRDVKLAEAVLLITPSNPA